ncbi:MAG: hypothetical protein ABIO36_08385 [Pyrinomonadaceae bacterium]
MCYNFETVDETQIYLIGLKYFTTGEWPYFGPDVSNTIQIPGALQGLVVGLPLYVLPVPEAPYVLVNILSFSSLCFFAWYCTKRFPEIPKWFLWIWLLTAPWTLGLSTHIFNPSYVLPGAILFFVSAIETYPFLTRNLIPLRWANFMMGLSLFWVMQFHMSWVIFIPYIAVSFYFQFKNSGRKAIGPLIYFVGGAILTGSFLIPTFIEYGFSEGMGSTNETVQLNSTNLLNHLNVAEGVLGRFLSFASFELPRFIGGNTLKRLEFMRENPWLIPFIIFLTVVGILQPIAMIILWFKKSHSQTDWKAMKYFTLATIVLLYISFLFSMRAPHSHTFYLTFPIAMLYSFYCWNEFLKKKNWKRFAAVFLVCGIFFNIGLALNNYTAVSIYVERRKIAEAIQNNDYHRLGERRVGSRY